MSPNPEETIPDLEDAIPEEEERNYYSSKEVAQIFRVSPKTIGRWHQLGKFEINGVTVQHSIGGHRRFMKDEIHELFQRMLRGELVDNDADPREDRTAT